MKETVKKMIHGRMEQAFQKFLWKNEDYLKSRAEYHALFGILKEKLRGSSLYDGISRWDGNGSGACKV